jgi:hypothetical protein
MKMKKINKVIILIFVFIFFKTYFSFSEENQFSENKSSLENKNIKIYENKNYLFNYPDNWELIENLADLDLALINTKTPTANIYIKTIKTNQKIEEYIDNEIKRMKESLLEKFDILKSEKKIIENKEVYILEYEFNQGTLDFKTLKYYIITPSTFYLLTYTNYKKDYQNNLKDFYLVFSSFKIK